MAKEREGENASGLASAEADARHRAAAIGVFTKEVMERVLGFIRALVSVVSRLTFLKIIRRSGERIL
jgi:hypothetical protein